MKDGTVRMFADYRALNKITIKNRAALPRADEMIERLHGAKVFSKIDLRQNYNQIRIDPKDVFKTAFNTRYGHFGWGVMPLGLTDAPATFTISMTDNFREYLDDFIIIYLDDMIISNKNAEEHAIHLKKVLELLRDNKSYAKLSKCELFKNKMEFWFHRGRGWTSHDA